MIYESHHPLSADYYKILRGENINFYPNMHYCYELIIVTAGRLHVKVNGQDTELHEGDGVLIFPNQIHSIHTEEYNRYVLCLFNHKLINAYNSKVASKVPVSNKFHCDLFYAEKLNSITENDSVMAIKGLLYSLCDEFDKNMQYIEFEKSSHYLLYNIFKFIEQNYNKTCTLAELSKSLGYDYTYLSSYFKKTTGMYYSDYVDQYRINQACYLLRESDMPVMQVSKECGFNSHRSFTRNFREQFEMTPAEYRKQYSKNAVEEPTPDPPTDE